MDNQTLYILIAAILCFLIIIILIVVNSEHKKEIKEEINKLYVRFNGVKTAPLAFKLNKAQLMAKRNEDIASDVVKYTEKYSEVEKHISEVQDILNNIEDSTSNNKYKTTKEDIKKCDEEIKLIEEQVKEIDEFLEEFSKKESEQREYSNKLKEKYRIVKSTINANAQALSFALEGFENKLLKCEELFSQAEEWMYASDYIVAQKNLEDIEELLENIKANANATPRLVRDLKGVIPNLLDEVNREYELTKQRGVFVEHLNIEETLKQVKVNINENIKKVKEADCIDAEVDGSKNALNDILEKLATENHSFDLAKETNEKTLEYIKELSSVENYVRVAYDRDHERFGLEDLKPALRKQREEIEKYNQQYLAINGDIASHLKPASEILADAERFAAIVDSDLKTMYIHKSTIDNSTDGEARAKNQLVKLQLVISSVETMIAESNLTSISSTYDSDLKKSRDYIETIRIELRNIPINISNLNKALNDAISFIYSFFNGVKNVVGMASMLEKTLVFGNKYRSTYPEIDRELSRAEFQYLNGEYTKGLKTAITCMESLFPENIDNKIMETL